jgi:hypothetical protein
MSPLAAVVIALIGLVVIFSATWAWQLKTANAGMVDPIWAYSLGLVAVLYAVLGTGDPLTRARDSARIYGSATLASRKTRVITASANNGAIRPPARCSGSSSCKS